MQFFAKEQTNSAHFFKRIPSEFLHKINSNSYLKRRNFDKELFIKIFVKHVSLSFQIFRNPSLIFFEKKAIEELFSLINSFDCFMLYCFFQEFIFIKTKNE